MNQQEASELTDQELQDKAKKRRSTQITNAVLIGCMMGIIIYSIAVNSLGFFTLIPLFVIYKLLKRSKTDKDTENS